MHSEYFCPTGAAWDVAAPHLVGATKRVELDAIHSMMTEGDQVEEIAVMTRSSIVAIEEVKIWRTAQEEDAIVQDAIQQMR